MNSLTKYWAKVEKARKELPLGDIYVMSIDNLESNSTAGTVAEVSHENAARLIAENKARVATPEEIEARREADKARADEIAAAELARKQPINIMLGPGTTVSSAPVKPADKPADTPASTKPADKPAGDPTPTKGKKSDAEN